MTQIRQLSCICGQVHLEVTHAPVASVECCCGTAGARIQRLPAPSPVREPNGAARFVRYRKDRIRYMTGRKFLKEFRLTPGSPTRRVVAEGAVGGAALKGGSSAALTLPCRSC